MEPQTLFLKIVVIGDAGVGKTSLIQQYCYGFFKPHTSSTIGCDFTTKVLTKFHHKTIRIQLWDIAGQEKYRVFSKLYLRGATGCIIVSDITKRESLLSGLKWRELASKCFEEESPFPIPIILFQNKVDLLNSEEKTEVEGNREILKEFDLDANFIGSVETSAKENNNIREGVMRLVEEIVRIRERNGSALREGDTNGDDEKKRLSFVVSPRAAKPKSCIEDENGLCRRSC